MNVASHRPRRESPSARGSAGQIGQGVINVADQSFHGCHAPWVGCQGGVPTLGVDFFVRFLSRWLLLVGVP